MSSNSETGTSQAFVSLHPGIQRWIWKQGWTSLREVQEKAIPPVLAGDRDVVISAATAAGKTEAAFLPMATRILGQPTNRTGFQVLVISPLKALINDQAERLSDLLGSVDISVHKRHGDVSQAARSKALSQPDGVLLITPESLEALFIQRGHQMPSLFAPLLALVVDELHAYIGTERGMQLQSLMHRLEMAVRRRVPRIGLSATLGDIILAAEALRPGGGYPRELVVAEGGGQSIRLKLYGVEHGPESDGDDDIARELFRTLRGDSHLIFANARNRVELYADRLRNMCDQASVPNEFWPHHGSLSKALREETEQALKAPGRPATAICTSTLELGIDIGRVASVVQLGCPPSVAAQRQRLGRSGRRGEPPVLRLYVQESTLSSKSSLLDRLRSHLFQTTAMVSLMGQRWIEPPEAHRPHLSTLVQQLLSLLAQWGEMTVPEAFDMLCGHGPFHPVGPETFKIFLRDLGSKKLIRQTTDRKLVLDLAGERLVNHYSFYAAFQTPQSFRLVHKGTTLGELPVDFPLVEKQALVFAGRRWLVISIDPENRVIHLTPSQGGKPPIFGGSGASVHDRVRQEMRVLYQGTIIPPFLDETSQRLFRQGQAAFSEIGLHHTPLMEDGNDTLLFPWMGDKVLVTIVAWLAKFNVSASQEWAALRIVGVKATELHNLLANMVSNGPPDPLILAQSVRQKQVEKHHPFLSDDLLNWELAHGHHFAPQEAWQVVRRFSVQRNVDDWLS